MIKTIQRLKWPFVHVLAAALALAALFGYRCPAQGCPLCKIVGQ